jgi:DNA-binding response OmpR family regulator
VAPGELRVADLCFDTATLRVTRGGREITLPPIPLRMLETLLRASPRVLSRKEMEHAIWGDAPPDSDALRSHLHLLRAAIDKPFDRPLLRTLRGLGWQIAAAQAADTPDHGTPP